jgi:hypothetical protein
MKQSMLKLLNEYCDAKNDILTLTNEHYDAMAYDIDGWYEYVEEGDLDEGDMLELTSQVHNAKALFKALTKLKYRFS